MASFVNKNSLLIACIVAVACIGVTSAITCHHCNSEFDPRCGDPFDSFSLGTKNCSTEDNTLDHLPDLKATRCRKTVMKIYGKVRIVRGCGFIQDDNDDKKCVKRSGTHDVYSLYCSCSTDLCNTASMPSFTGLQKMMLLVVLPIALMFTHGGV